MKFHKGQKVFRFYSCEPTLPAGDDATSRGVRRTYLLAHLGRARADGLAGVLGLDAVPRRRAGLSLVGGQDDQEGGDEEDAIHPLYESRLSVVPADEGGRTLLWRGFAEALHEPAERAVHVAASRFLLAQRRRMAARVPAAMDTYRALGQGGTIQRDLFSDLVAYIVSEAGEIAAMRDSFAAVLRKVMGRSMRAAFRQLGEPMAPDPARVDAEVDRQLGQLVAGATDATKADIARIVQEGISRGETVNEIQRRIQAAAAFGPSRALRIARPAATKSVNAGAVNAYGQAADGGISVRQQWLTSRDAHVRDEHRPLDGQEVGVGEPFTARDGSTARWPGDFADAAMSVNCRCTVVPIA